MLKHKQKEKKEKNKTMDENTSQIINSLNEEVCDYIRFLETIESTCTDDKTNKKIKEFLKSKKVW